MGSSFSDEVLDEEQEDVSANVDLKLALRVEAFAYAGEVIMPF